MKQNAVVLLFAASTLLAQERSAQLVLAPAAPTFSFGMIGLGMNSSARLNVVNLVRTAPPVLIPQILCKVELDLYDSQGKLIKQKTVTNLGYGQADFLELSRTEASATGTHIEITGVVKVGSSQSIFCNISSTLEVFDNLTGATTAILPGTTMSPPLIFSTVSPAAEQSQ